VPLETTLVFLLKQMMRMKLVRSERWSDFRFSVVATIWKLFVESVKMMDSLGLKAKLSGRH